MDDELMYEAYLNARAIVDMYEETMILREENRRLQSIVDEHDRELNRRVREGHEFVGSLLTAMVSNVSGT